ncbi:hypothetical protein [Mucilaginibacter antarcticus]|uniref:Lipocalin-like protein n=1 Tax=Mucilaginibacter antarcticus TaxID=1855725 RepID=A0ABW5XM91_9SPHI
MKYKLPFTLIFGLLAINLLVNSCKKEQRNTLPTLLTTGGAWQLASVQYTILVGDTVKLDTALNIDCDTTQIFTFTADNNCTYTNFNCKVQPTARGKWQLSQNRLFLNSTVVCQDTTAAGSSTPFSNAQIVNLGEYSLVLRTGDLQNFNNGARRKVIRYGFVRQKASVQ